MVASKLVLPFFKDYLILFDGLRKGWKEGCRRIICVDAVFLKTFLGGQILTAIGRDPNDQMFPIAWAVVEGENNLSWEWFFTHLLSCLELSDGTGIAIVSDEHPAILSVVATEMGYDGLPCCHAIACIYFLNKEAEPYVDDCYKREVYLRVYGNPIPALVGERHWPKVDTKICPPPIKIGPGRLRKNRIKDPYENTKKPGKLTRHDTEMTCKLCNQKGHNKRGCPDKAAAVPQEHRPKKPRGRPRKGSTSGDGGRGSASGSNGGVVRGRGNARGRGRGRQQGTIGVGLLISPNRTTITTVGASSGTPQQINVVTNNPVVNTQTQQSQSSTVVNNTPRM